MNEDSLTLANEKRRDRMKRIVDSANSGDFGRAFEHAQGLYSDSLQQASERVFGGVKAGDKHFATAVLTQHNLANFSARKATVLVDELKGAKDAEEQKRIVQRHNRWLSVEYNTAIARSRTARQWDVFQTQRRLYPNIEWLRTRAVEPDLLHLSYVGKVWAMDDPFLQNNQPGNRYGCKCDWKTTDRPVTELETKQVPPSPGLEGNPATTGDIYSKQHPYFEATQAYEAAERLATVMPEQTYLSTQASNGDQLLFNLLHPRDGLVKELECCSDLAALGYKDIRLLPDFNAKITNLAKVRAKYLPKRFIELGLEGDPDALVTYMGQTLVTELKVMEGGMRNFANRLADAAKKAELVVVKLPSSEAITDRQLGRIDALLSNTKHLKGVLVLDSKGKQLVKRLRGQ